MNQMNSLLVQEPVFCVGYKKSYTSSYLKYVCSGHCMFAGRHLFKITFPSFEKNVSSVSKTENTVNPIHKMYRIN